MSKRNPEMADAAQLADRVLCIPVFTPTELAAATPDALLGLLIEHCDRVPRNLFDACVARGQAMVRVLADLSDRALDIIDGGEHDGEWWALLHAVNILGQSPSADAGAQLLKIMRAVDTGEDDNLMDWLASSWPHVFVNKPSTVTNQLHDLLLDRDVDWSLRADAATALASVATAAGGVTLETLLDDLMALASDPADDTMFRFLLGSMLLDFPRPRHRDALMQLVPQQRQAHENIFSEADIDRALAQGSDEPNWSALSHPLDFYNDDAIQARQQLWADEAAAMLDGEGAFDEFEALDESEDHLPVEQPYVRETPKIGRNDPCPCGSGKKYKKCCL